MQSIVVSATEATRLVTPNKDRHVEIVVLNLSTSVIEIFDHSHAEVGQGFPLVPGGEYTADGSGEIKLWGLSLDGPALVAVSRTVVERVPVTWGFKGPVEDTLIARLPFYEAQNGLRGAVDAKTRTLASCEWHGSGQGGDPERTSFAMVNEGGPLIGLVGERVALDFGGRQVFAYVHRSASLDSDMSVTRRLFMALAPLSTTQLDLTVGTVL